MKARRGEKAGWIGGWSGSFAWLLVLVVLLVAKDQFYPALIGLALTAVASFCIFRFAPWKIPSTQYWKLLLPIYGVLFLAVIFAVTVGDRYGFKLEWRYLFWIFPLLIPFFTMGRRTWDQGAE